MLRLFTDSDTDITPKKAKEYGYTIISMPYSANGEDVYPYRDSDTVDFKAFYKMLRDGVLPSTSALTPERYIEYFEPVFAAGDDILYVHFSAAMSATFGFLEKALAVLKEKYPERRLYRIDTKAITIGSLAVLEELGELFKAGRSIEELLEWAEKEVGKYAMYFYADDLKFFSRSGRVSGITAAMGNLLGVRPIIYMNEEGVMTNIGKERGRIKALSRLLSYVEELGEDVKSHPVIIGHTDAEEAALELGKMLTEKLGEDLKIEYVYVNPTAGSHCGPDAIGICFHAVHR